MLSSFLKFFTPPTFPDDEEKTRLVAVIYRVLLVTYIHLPMALTILALDPAVGRFYLPVAIVLVAASTVFMFITRRGYPRAASMAIITAFVVLSTFIDFNANGDPQPILILSAAAERAGLAIGNSRPLTEAQRRASNERAISETTGRIGFFTNVQEIMQATVNELGRALEGVETTLQIQPPDEK